MLALWQVWGLNIQFYKNITPVLLLTPALNTPYPVFLSWKPNYQLTVNNPINDSDFSPSPSRKECHLVFPVIPEGHHGVRTITALMEVIKMDRGNDSGVKTDVQRRPGVRTMQTKTFSKFKIPELQVNIIIVIVIMI